MNPQYTEARQQLHTIAEWLLAGPQYSQSATIRLGVEAGFITTVASPEIRVSGRGLLTGDRQIPLAGTVAQIGLAAGLVPQRPEVGYRDPVPGGPDSIITAAPEAIDEVIAVYTVGAIGLAFVTDDIPVLWPEHFDLAVRIDDVNVGVSPGDGLCAQPYAYVGPGARDDDPFWNAPFGALLAFDPTQERAADRISVFFDEGLQKARSPGR